jgi:hypothetical protein
MRRVTIVIDENLDKLIRNRQAKLILKTQGSYSYSKVVCELARKGLVA